MNYVIAPITEATTAAAVMTNYVSPVMHSLYVIASLVCGFFLLNSGYHYMTSGGNPEKLLHAKRILKTSIIGLVIVFAGGALTSVLNHAYEGSGQIINQKLPSLTQVEPAKVSNGLIDILVKAVAGVLNNIIQSMADPFLNALKFFTSHTPLMSDNSSVFNLWLAIAGMCDVLYVLVIALLGFHIMSATTLGFEEIDIKHLLPRLALIFLFINTSIFVIDGVIELSNVMIKAINDSGAQYVWDSLTSVVKQSGFLGVGGLLIMMAFLIFSVILLIYYVGRLVTLYVGAVLSPLVLLLWLIPGFKDFAETTLKTYLVTIFVLFVNVVILELAASLFYGIHTRSTASGSGALMPLIVGLATLISLLKTQSVLVQFNYAGMGARSLRKIGSEFISGVSFVSTRSKKEFQHTSGYKEVSNVGDYAKSIQHNNILNYSPGTATTVKTPPRVNKHSNSYKNQELEMKKIVATPSTKISKTQDIKFLPIDAEDTRKGLA